MFNKIWFTGLMIMSVSLVIAQPTDCMLLAAGWILVRWTKSTTNWHSATDWLAGTDTYCSAVECSVNFEGALSGWD